MESWINILHYYLVVNGIMQIKALCKFKPASGNTPNPCFFTGHYWVEVANPLSVEFEFYLGQRLTAVTPMLTRSTLENTKNLTNP